MAMQQEKQINASDLDPALPNQMLPVSITTRLRELRFPYPSDENIIFVFEPFVGDATGSKQKDVEIHLKSEVQPGNPVNPIKDDNGNVVVAANEFAPPIPSISQVREMNLPEGPVTISNFGELFDLARRAIYLSSMQLNPDWADAVEG